jgi:hypothetical protein
MGGQWGPWTYNPCSESLDHANGYQVDLKWCVGSAGVLDAIAQVAAKAGRFSPVDTGHLVHALHGLAHLQEHFCGCGTDHADFSLVAHLRRGRRL